jgi:hypothetical protein
VRLLQAGEVLPAALGAAVFLETPRAAGGSEALAEEVTEEAMVEVAVPLKTPKAAGALEALAEEVTGEAMVEVTGKLKE